jgi:hypothetical protein
MSMMQRHCAAWKNQFPGHQGEAGNGPFSGLRVVHAANFQTNKDGAVFFNCDQKLQHGLIQNGCFAYAFDVNTRARLASWTRRKRFGRRAANQALVRTCRNVQPDVLLLGHTQNVARETLLEIRDVLPDIRIGLWYIDPLWNADKIRHLHERADLLDAIFATTGGELLNVLSRPNCPAAFFPNPVEWSIERLRAFECLEVDYDVVFFGSDKHEPERRGFLQQFVRGLPQVRLGIFGALGNQPVFGAEKEAILAKSRMGLNLSRKNDVELYSSDRIAQLTGNGLLALSQRGSGLEQLYEPDEMVFFADVDDLHKQVRELQRDNERAREMARRGRRKSHDLYSACAVAKFMIRLLMRDEAFRTAPWSRYVYWTGRSDQAAGADSGESAAGPPNSWSSRRAIRCDARPSP